MLTLLNIDNRVARVVTFGKKFLPLASLNFVTSVSMPPKLLPFHLIINIYFGPNLSKYCTEITAGNVGARVVLPQIEVFSKKKTKKVITCLTVTNCATRGKLD